MRDKIAVLIIFIWVSYAQSAWGLKIMTPSEGEIVYAGARLDVIVKPDPGEKWEEVLIGIFPMSYNLIKDEYKEEIEIPEDVTGTIDYSVLAYDKSGKKVKLTRKLFVKLPLNVVLQSIKVDPDFILLEKMPPDSKPEDIKAFSTKKLRVKGIYSDGVKRKLTASSSGTTYTSSNEKVAKVSPEGEIEALGSGTAAITVRNDKHSTTVKVDVEPYK